MKLSAVLKEQKKKKDDDRGTVYDYKKDTLALVSSMVDDTFGQKMYDSLMDDLGETDQDTVDRYKPEGWNTVQDVKNIRAGFVTTPQGDKVLRLTYHNVVVLPGCDLPEKYVDEASKLLNKCVTQLKKEYKKIGGETLTTKVVKVKGTRKDGLYLDYEVVSNPRVETSNINSVVGSQPCRVYMKISKFYSLGDEQDTGVENKHGDDIDET